MNALAYYNEIDPEAAAVLRHLIAEGLIAPGDVDERSIRDVSGDDLKGYAQVHLFAGAGIWSIAARMAGWADDRPLWSGSCPCQPFSAAGKRAGTDDPRHLWPDFLRLIRSARANGSAPPVIVGEQVAGALGYGWFDGVRADLEEEGYASRARDIPACAVDAPHQRNRLWWLAVTVDLVDATSLGRRQGWSEPELRSGRSAASCPNAPGVALGDAVGAGLEGHAGNGDVIRGPEQDRPTPEADGAGAAGALGGTDSGECERERLSAITGESLPDARRADGPTETPRPNGTFWSGAEWIICHDGKARRTEPSIRLLVDGMAGRIGLWRLAGNSIVPELAAQVIAAADEALRGMR